MRCAAMLTSGEPCAREAEGDAPLCSYHQKIETSRQNRAFYVNRLSADDREALAVAARLEGVDAEIAVLRVLIRRVVDKGNIEAARRGIDTLCRVLKDRHDLDGHTDTLTSSLERVLDTLEQELEISA